MELFLQILYTVLVLGALILLHEFGHFITARIFKVRVNEFSIGMGPKLLSLKNKKLTSFFSKPDTEPENEGSTRYSLRLLPIGGYVAMEGENEDTPHPDAFTKKPAWQRLIVILAGGVMNLLTAFVVTLILSSQTYVMTTQIGGFQEYATSNTYGLQIGDIVKSVNGVTVSSYSDFSYAFQTTLGQDSTTVVVERDGQTVVVENVRFPMIYMSTGELVTEETEAALAEKGESLSKMMYFDFKLYGSLPTAKDLLPETFKTMWSNVKTVYGTLWDLVTGKLSAEYVSGPIGISSMIKQAADYGFLAVLNIAALISVNLAVVNLLPLPALDGGRGAFILVEMIRRKKVPEKIEASVHGVGMIVLLVLIALIAFKDIFFPIS